MRILAWLVLGPIAGFIASKLMRAGGYGLIGDIVVGLVGAILGGSVVGLLTGNRTRSTASTSARSWWRSSGPAS